MGSFTQRYTEAEISKVAQSIIKNTTSKTLCFYGEMGAGKTTLIKALVTLLGSTDSANSPTFGIVNEYEKHDNSLLGYHFDFYRIDDESEILDLGFDDYLNKNCWVFIEWPEKIPSLLPIEKVDIHISIIDETTRQINF